MRTMVYRTIDRRDAADSRAFSRVELMVVVLMLCCLALIEIPALGNARHQTNRAQCAGNLKQLVLAFDIYASENGDKLPPGAGHWAWDFPWNLATNLSRYGTTV